MQENVVFGLTDVDKNSGSLCCDYVKFLSKTLLQYIVPPLKEKNLLSTKQISEIQERIYKQANFRNPGKSIQLYIPPKFINLYLSKVSTFAPLFLPFCIFEASFTTLVTGIIKKLSMEQS